MATDRRHASWILVIGAVAGAGSILALDRYRGPLRDWLAVPGQSAGRVTLVMATLALVSTAPLLGFAIYLWRLGARGPRLLAAGLAVSAVALSLLLWRLAWLVTRQAA